MQRGYTLIEVILSIAIMSILALGISRVSVQSVSISKESSNIASMQANICAGIPFLEENIGSKSNILRIHGSSVDSSEVENQLESKDRVELQNIFLESTFKNEKSTNDGFGIRIIDKGSLGKKMFYYKNLDGASMMECLSGIDRVYAEPIPEGKSFSECYGVRFIFEIPYRDNTQFKKSIYFANNIGRY